jgi:4-coumarate--CoA ligase
MTYALKTANAKFLATHPSSIAVAAQAAKNAGIPQSRIFLLEGTLDGYTTVRELIETGRAYGAAAQVPAFELPPGKKNRELCGFLSFSSGTTGLPKAVCDPKQIFLRFLSPPSTARRFVAVTC